MNIAFWSKYAGSGVTSSAVAVGVLLSEMYQRRITMMEEEERNDWPQLTAVPVRHFLWQEREEFSLPQMLMGRRNCLAVAEEKQYAHLCQMRQSRWGYSSAVPKRFVSDSILEILRNGLYYRVPDKPPLRAADVTHLRERLKAALNQLSSQFDDILIDTGIRKAFVTEYLFDCADLVVVVLSLGQDSVEAFLREYHSELSNCVFLLIGSGKGNDPKQAALFRKYGISTGRVAHIPYSHTYRHAVDSGQLILYLREMCRAKRETEAYEQLFYWKKVVRMILRNGQRRLQQGAMQADVTGD